MGQVLHRVWQRRGQAGMEYILLFALLLAVLVPVFAYSLSASSLEVRAGQSRVAVQQIAAAADNLYKFGGGKTTIFVAFPSGITAASAGNRSISLTLRIGEGTGTAHARTTAAVNGTLPLTEGVKQISLEVIGTTVQIS